MSNQNNAKIILHIDMNAFFCSVACLLNPSLRGKVFAIGRENSYRGVISSASYEARAKGIHAAMSQIDAYNLVPDLIIVHLDYSYYQLYHNKFVAVLKQYSKLVEVASIDEAYVDITEASIQKHPLIIAKEIQTRILKEIGLSCSIGIAPTLFLAKMASDMKKPLGITVLRKREVKELLYPLSVADIFGIGKKTYPVLIDNNIKTIGDFLNPLNKSKVIKLVGDNTYNYVVNHVLGNSSNIVNPNRYSDYESISTSQTFDRVIASESEALYELRKMTREIVNKMDSKNYYTKTITITLRDITFKTINRSKSLDDYTNDYNMIYDVVVDLLEENFNDGNYRLLGVGLSNLKDLKDLPKPYNLFTIENYDDRKEKINAMIKEYQEKYGEKALFQNKK